LSEDWLPLFKEDRAAAEVYIKRADQNLPRATHFSGSRKHSFFRHHCRVWDTPELANLFPRLGNPSEMLQPSPLFRR
jgi:hypothetical protein